MATPHWKLPVKWNPEKDILETKGLRKIKWGYKLTQEQAARQEQERAGTEEKTSSKSRVQLLMPDKQPFLLFLV